MITALAPPAVLIVLSWLILERQGYFLIDDAYIGFRYASNLAQGHGLVWNPGDPVEGYTNLLWVLLLTPFAALGLDLMLPAAVMGTLASCGCLEVLRRIARRVWPGRSVLIQTLPALILATNPSFAFWSTSGMETPLFALLVVLSLHLLLLGRERPGLRLLAGFTLAAGCLTRPEGLLVAGIFLLVELFSARGGLMKHLGYLIAPGAVVAAIVGAHMAFRLSYYGDFLPNTFYAKVIIGRVSLIRGVVHLESFLLGGGLVVLPGLLALRWSGPLRRYLGHGYILLGVYVAYLVLIGGDHPLWFRFFVPLLPLPLLGLTEVADRVGRLLASRILRSNPRARVVAGGAALFLLTSSVAVCWPRAEPSAARDIRDAGHFNAVLFGAFFKNYVPRDSFVAASAVGALGYFSEYRILDAWGLNDRHIAHNKVSANPAAKFGHDKQDWLYVLNQLPDFIYTFCGREPGQLKGYDICWPSRLRFKFVIYRRNFALTEDQLTRGMPPGQRRTLILPPGCKSPGRLMRQLARPDRQKGTMKK